MIYAVNQQKVAKSLKNVNSDRKYHQYWQFIAQD